MLGDDLDEGLHDLRAEALSVMRDRCVIREPDAWAGETRTEGPIAWHYEGSDQIPCRVRVDDQQPRWDTVGGERTILLEIAILVPIDVCPTKNQVVTVVSAEHDPHTVGLRFDVVAASLRTHAAKRRVTCVEHR